MPRTSHLSVTGMFSCADPGDCFELREGAEAQTSLEILVHPARARPLMTAFLVVFLTTLAATLGPALVAPLLCLRSQPGTALLLVLLAVAQRGYLLPTRYRFDEAGVSTTSLGTRTWHWARFRCWRRERGGVYLSPFSDPTRFDHYRGLFLPVDTAAHRVAIEEFLGKRLPVAGVQWKERCVS